MNKIYAIGIGGSGAKGLEATIFLHALGIFGDSRLGILLVDADAHNGNGQRTQANLTDTLNCHGLFKKPSADLGSGFMAGEWEDYGTWNPLGDLTYSSNLRKIFNRQSLESGNLEPLAKLFDALYSPDEQEADLAVGFRGRPPIGSAVMSRLELETTATTALSDNWQRFFNHIESDLGTNANNEVTIHLFGSIFGGTGASGVPTLATLIANQLKVKNLRHRVHLNASLFLPYFSFEPPNKEEEKVFAETRFFALNTQAALQYLTEHSPGVFDTVYLIGDQERKSYESSTGGTKQNNKAHFVELYGALAINHGSKQAIGQTKAAYISRNSADQLLWQDLPDSDQVKKRLSKGVRFAYSWYYNFAQELVAAKKLGVKKFAKGAPWFPVFFTLNKEGEENFPSLLDETQVKQAEVLEKWTKIFLIWASQVAESHHKGEQLFRLQERLQKIESQTENRPYREHLSDLIIDGVKSAKDKSRDRLDTYKNQLADQGKLGQGVVGLAHELFRLL